MPCFADHIQYRNFNSQINAIRHRNNSGVYDIHTNIMQYPTIMQPTAARIQQIAPGASPEDDSQTLPPLNPSIARNFTVTDTYYETPPVGISPASYDRRNNAHADSADLKADFLAPFRGLDAIPADVKDCLPPECREALENAAANELSYQIVRLFPIPSFW